MFLVTQNTCQFILIWQKMEYNDSINRVIQDITVLLYDIGPTDVNASIYLISVILINPLFDNPTKRRVNLFLQWNSYKKTGSDVTSYFRKDTSRHKAFHIRHYMTCWITFIHLSKMLLYNSSLRFLYLCYEKKLKAIKAIMDLSN